MNKIDKFLYGGFAVVVIAGIVAMLVFVFSPPKQAEENAKPQKATVEKQPTKQIEEVPDQMEQWQEDVEQARWRREVAEELAALIQAEEAAEQAALEEQNKARKEWWEARREWVERFPFEPTPHPEITYEPEVYKNGDDSKKMKKLMRNHGFLRNFYASYLPYTEEFEQMYNIIEEEFGATDNTIALGHTFETLKSYQKASQNDPEEIYQRNVQIQTPIFGPQREIPDDEFNNMSFDEQQKILAKIMHSQLDFVFNRRIPPPEVRDITWGEEVEELKECIIGPLMNPKTGVQGISREQAITIRDRLINEIPAEGFLEMPNWGLVYTSKYESELKPGDPLLIK